MTLFLIEEKLTKIKIQCQDIFSQPQITILELTTLIGFLSSQHKQFLQ